MKDSKYLTLFFLFQVLALILIFVNLVDVVQVIVQSVRVRNDSFSIMVIISLFSGLIKAIVISIILVLFLKRSPHFIPLYKISALCSIIFSLIEVAFMREFLMYMEFFDIADLILQIIFNIVMLYFWSNFFKESLDVKIYIQAGVKLKEEKRKQKKLKKAKKKLKVIK